MEAGHDVLLLRDVLPKKSSDPAVLDYAAGLLMSRRCGKSRGVNPKEFFPELRRRNVYNGAVEYAAASWLLIQSG